MGGGYSSPRRGGVAQQGRGGRSAERCAGLTTPSAPLRSLRDILLMAQTPLLSEEGNILGHLPSLPQQMSPNREPGHRSTSQDVKHIERRKKEYAHARHSTPALVISKWTISAGKLVP